MLDVWEVQWPNLVGSPAIDRAGLESAPDIRAGGGAPAIGSRLSTLATCGFGVQTSLEAHHRLSCPHLADTALKP